MEIQEIKTDLVDSLQTSTSNALDAGFWLLSLLCVFALFSLIIRGK